MQARIGRRRGRHPLWGVLDTINGLADTSGNQAPLLTLGLIPASTLGLAAMLDPANQGARVRVLTGAADMTSGRSIGEPYEMFTGELDVPTSKWGMNDRRVEFRVTSIVERCFANDEGQRLTDAFHQSVWPGEKGLGFVLDVETWVPWGQEFKAPSMQIRTNGGG